MLNKNNFRIYDFCSRDATRFVLNHVLIETNRTMATNGKYAIVVSNPQADEVLKHDKPILIHWSAAKSIYYDMKTKKGESPEFKFRIEDNKVVFLRQDIFGSIERRFAIVEGAFPIIDNLKTNLKKEPHEKIVIGAGLVKTISQFFVDFGAGGFEFESFGEQKLCIFRGKNMDEQKAEIMLVPMRKT